MKNRLIYFSVAAMIIASCTKQTTITTDVTEPTEIDMLSISVTNSTDSAITRLALTENSLGGISLTWAEQDEYLGGWCSGKSEFVEFVMDETTLSEDKQSAIFNGENLQTTMRLIYPYDSNPQFVDGKYTIDFSSQTIDVSSDSGLSSIAQNLYMLSSEFEPQDSVAPAMKHMGSVLKIGLCFDGLDESNEYKITRLLFGGNGGLTIPLKAYADLEKDVTDSDFTTLALQGDDEADYIDIKVEGCEDIVNADENFSPIYYTNIATLPFTITPGDTIKLAVELTDKDESTISKVYNIIYPGTVDFEIPRSSYTYINYFCAIEVDLDATIKDWDYTTNLDIATDY